MRTSKIFHEIALVKMGVKILAPYPNEKKKTNEALIAPNPKRGAKLPNLVETEPSKMTVSRYT